MLVWGILAVLLAKRPAALDPSLIDLRAFYCAGSVANAGANPYYLEPLRTCEWGTLGDRSLPAPGYATPAPLPGYMVGIFRLLSLLPFPALAGCFFLGIAFSFAVLVRAMQRLTGLGWAAIVLAFAPGGALLHSLFLGQLVPFAVAALAGSAVLLRQGRARPAALLLVLAMCEPQLALGSVLAMFLFVPASRAVLAACGAALLAAAIAAIGTGANIDYVTTVIPLHVASELRNVEQFGVAPLLVLAGVPARTAISLGEIALAFGLIAGIACAGPLFRLRKDGAFIVLVPPVFALLSGPYVHAHHLAAAMPVALLVYAQWPQFQRVAGLVVLGLAVPWTDFWTPRLPIVPGVFAGALAVVYLRLSRAAGVGAGLSAMAFVWVGSRLGVRSSGAGDGTAGLVPAGPWAEAAWAAHIQAEFSGGSFAAAVLKAPTLAALWTLAIVLLLLAVPLKKDGPPLGDPSLP